LKKKVLYYTNKVCQGFFNESLLISLQGENPFADFEGNRIATWIFYVSFI